MTDPRFSDTSAPTDEEWFSLLSTERMTATQKEAERQFGEIDSETYGNLRRRAKTDSYFLAYSLLGYTELNTSLHTHFCHWLDGTRGEQYRLTLLPRGHFKTTIETITDAIQMVLPDSTGLMPFPYNLGPNLRLMLGHETGDGASRFLFEITGHLTGNPLIVGLFPELVPSPRKQRMNQSMLELPRDGFWAEPTIDTMGVGAKSQGRHYDKIKLDDIFGEKARDSEAERKTTIQWFHNITSFFVNPRQGCMDIVGTRYSLDDVYGIAMRKYGGRMRRYIRKVEELDIDQEIDLPIFPEHFPPEYIAILKQDPKTWIQYSNDPRSDFREFDDSWKRFYHWSPDRQRVYVFGADGRPGISRRVRDLDITILCDPSVSLAPGIIVTGTDPQLNVFILQTYKKPTTPPQFVDLIFRLVQTWWPRLVSIEAVVFSVVYKYWIEREMMLRNCRFKVYPYEPPSKLKKQDRVRALSNYFSSGQIFFNEEEQADILEEYDTFGASAEGYHLLDALAQGPEVWRAGLTREMLEKRHKEEMEFLEGRDKVSGYSRI